MNTRSTPIAYFNRNNLFQRINIFKKYREKCVAFETWFLFNRDYNNVSLLSCGCTWTYFACFVFTENHNKSPNSIIDCSNESRCLNFHRFLFILVHFKLFYSFESFLYVKWINVGWERIGESNAHNSCECEQFFIRKKKQHKRIRWCKNVLEL